MSTIPFFSIIIPTYNRGDLLMKTIESVLHQGFERFELIVVDDGGTDQTEALVQQIQDPRVRYYKKDNGERGAARNFGIQKAIAPYVTFIDSDDLLYPHAFQHAYDQLLASGQPEFYAQAFEVIDIHTGAQLQKPVSFNTESAQDQILKGNFLGCIGVFVQREVLQEIRFEEDRMFAGTEDWLLWLRLSARYTLHFSAGICARMIEHERRSVLGFSEEKLRYRSEYLKKSLCEDEVFRTKFGMDCIERIYAHMLSYTALHLAMSGHAGLSMQYLLAAFKSNKEELWSRRTLGIFKTMIKKLF